MLKRNIFILAAGMLLSAQVAVAADQRAGPQNAEPQAQPCVPIDYESECTKPLPAELKYLDEHPPVHTPSPMDNVWPPSAGD